ncbi:MAG: hypothetical protein KHW39_03940, partial [Megasphaera micronuciformis]|nr:hypothetical protein [Megasphaera micronuciformis]
PDLTVLFRSEHITYKLIPVLPAGTQNTARTDCPIHISYDFCSIRRLVLGKEDTTGIIENIHG